MAAQRVTPLPFAFLLALAGEAGANSAAPLPFGGQPLEPGMLAELFKHDGAPDFKIKSVDEIRDGKRATVVQYFPNFPNFRNCVAGYWRNC